MENINDFKAKIFSLLDDRKFDEVVQILDTGYDYYNSIKERDYEMLIQIAGSYITTGSESFNLELVNKGISIITNERAKFEQVATKESIDYCLANGYHAIYKIKLQKDLEFQWKPKNVSNELFKAKQFYLSAFKNIDLERLDDFSIQVLTNLGNNLNHSGRVVEALQLFDTVLKFNPNFPQAIYSKADGLRYMIQITQGVGTISLYGEMYRLYSASEKFKFLSPENLKSVKYWINSTEKLLTDNSIEISTIHNHFNDSYNEYLEHDDELKFYLDNFLSLSEHSLYCKCAMSEHDNLSIGYQGLFTTDQKLINLEALNNQIKSEYSTARHLYFEFEHKEIRDFVYYEIVFQELTQGINFERIRVSFRLCFGILDKIAEGICYLFNFEKKKNEKIYFENFWNPKGFSKRWEDVNSINNIHLTALYSIACDLNKSEGQLGFYKQWRNKLEHGLFIITSDRSDESIIPEIEFSTNTSLEDFRNKTRLLLQITRAAIFSFVFCVRRELISK